MNQQQRVVQYVLENGPCTDLDVFKNATRVNPRDMRRHLVDGAPEGMVACEQRTGKNDYIFVYAESPPDGFEPIKIRGRADPAG